MAEKRSKTPGGTAKIKHDAYDEAVDAEEDFDADIDVGGSADLQGRQNVGRLWRTYLYLYTQH